MAGWYRGLLDRFPGTCVEKRVDLFAHSRVPLPAIWTLNSFLIGGRLVFQWGEHVVNVDFRAVDRDLIIVNDVVENSL
jgi:hypothetical protein